ncbi:MAG TPA: hypothetical protein VNX01_11120 [Bacteroidia bacterium]|jgi:hypothetical protein|nr:hypothetical protein [Bacteroidia bacterium]
MKKIFTIASVFALGLVITFACKKSTTTTTPASTTSTTGSNSNVTSITVDGSALSSMTVTAGATSTEYRVSASSTNNSNLNYPTMYITFSGNTMPTAGTYTISSYSALNLPANGYCYFQYNTNYTSTGSYVASTGVVTITPGTPNTAACSNVVCTNTAGSHTITAALKF